MDAKITDRFEERLSYLNKGLTIPKRTKKIVTVHEAIGRLKDQHSKVAKLYSIEYMGDTAQGVITQIKRTRVKDK
jgi:hypothetical protein